MISIEEITARLQLHEAFERIRTHDTTSDISLGLWVPANDYLLPAPHNTRRQRAWDRAKRQTQALGPRILNTKLGSILGDVSWGGNNDDLDERLDTLDLRSLARRLLTPYITHGITAAIASTPESDGEARITRLGGYLEGITHPDDVDRIVGIYQVITLANTTASATQSKFSTPTTNERGTRSVTYHVRVYDWLESDDDRADLREWRDLRDPTRLDAIPEETAGVQRPRYRIKQQTPEGLPLGEIEMLTPDIMALWATEARLTLSEEMAAFPMLKVMGEALGDDWAIGPAEPLALSQDSDAEWMEPGNLDELRQQRLLRLERIREDASLPGGFLGRDSPSGEAFREANVRFRQNTDSYATDMEGLLTELVSDYAGLAGISEPPAVSVTPSKEYEAKERIDSIIALRAANLIPLKIAAVELQPFFSTWSDDDLNEWVEERSATVDPEEFNRLVGSQPQQPQRPEVDEDAPESR